ncbi:conjugative relaxase domain-containing protein, TrwC/TraI family, partial [Thermomonospora echinospora]
TLADVEAWCAYGMRGEHGGGKTARRVDTSGLLGWVMWHDEARPVDGQDPDPHVHAHAVIAHMVRGVDGQWSTPGNGGREFHRHIEAAGALVRARLRAKTTAMGFRWERQPGGRVWELAGVPAELRVVFSKRQGQIHRLLQRLGFEDPRTASTAHAKVAAARSREGKDTAGTSSAQASPSTTVHGGDLRGSWRRQADDAGHEPGMVVAAARPGGPDDGPTIGGPGDGPTPPPPPTPGVREVAERIFAPDTGLTAHNKVATQPRVLAAVLDELPGVADVADAERLAAAVVALPDGPAVPLPAAGGRERGPAFQTHPERYTSADIVEAERTALALTEHGLRHGADEGLAVVDGEVTAMAIGAFEAAKGFALSTQQRAVVERLTGAGHGVDAVIGVAGAGKTTLMAAARSAWNVAGFTVRGATTAAAAAQQLAAESGIPAQT